MSEYLKGRLENQVAIVTGSSRGIGRATAIILAQEGAKVAVNYRQQKERAQEVVTRIQETGGHAFTIQADVGDKGAVEKMVKKTLVEFSRVDILVNNAGLLRRGSFLLKLKDEDFDAMLKTNVKGVLYCTQAVVPYMMEQKSGKIVNISSVGGLGTSNQTGSHLYGATKGAVNIMTKRFALELGPYGINVNAIAPGLIRTDMPRGTRSPREWEQRLQKITKTTMLRRIGEPEDIGYAALFLASEESRFITGQVITVDGGRMNFITHSL